MENLLEMARRPAVSIGPEATVRQLAELLAAEHVGAAMVLGEDDALIGIVSERDVLVRVLAAHLDPDATRVSAIMTTDVRTAPERMKIQEALDVMRAGKFRHLPIVDGSRRVLGMLSMRHLLQRRVYDLDMKNADLMMFLAADGAGG
jgi:CBS domain-containing protein